MKIENETQAMFALKHGHNQTDSMVYDLMVSLSGLINASEVDFRGKKCKLKLLGLSRHGDDENFSLLFDVKNPDDTFDHVEFKITKTGWGRAL